MVTSNCTHGVSVANKISIFRAADCSNDRMAYNSAREIVNDVAVVVVVVSVVSASTGHRWASISNPAHDTTSSHLANSEENKHVTCQIRSYSVDIRYKDSITFFPVIDRHQTTKLFQTTLTEGKGSGLVRDKASDSTTSTIAGARRQQRTVKIGENVPHIRIAEQISIQGGLRSMW